MQQQTKMPPRVPHLTESFVKRANTESVEEECQISTTEAGKESVSVNMSKEESNAMKDSANETNTASSTNHKKDTKNNSQKSEPVENGDDVKGRISEQTELSSPRAKTVTPHVKQNFSAINVELEYTGDDVQPLEENDGGEEDISVESESEDESETGGDRGSALKDEEQDDIRAAYGKPDTEYGV